jgi:hypothetical protein
MLISKGVIQLFVKTVWQKSVLKKKAQPNSRKSLSIKEPMQKEM